MALLTLPLDNSARTEIPITIRLQLSRPLQPTLPSIAQPSPRKTTSQLLGQQATAPLAPTLHAQVLDNAATITTSLQTHSPTQHCGQTTSAWPQPAETQTSTGGPTAPLSTSTSQSTKCAVALLP